MPVRGDVEVKWSQKFREPHYISTTLLKLQGDLESRLIFWGFQETGYEKPMCKAG